MNIILLSGGSGKRLWPLSNEIRSKQFLKIYKKDDGSYESMIQRVYRQIRTVDPESVITVATSKSQVSSIRNQLGYDVGISIEPSRRDTFPAIALAVSYVHDVLNADLQDSVIVCPIDHYVDDTYYQMAERIGRIAKESNAELVLMGIKPDEASDKYGYIIPTTGEEVSKVREFKEKPDTDTAKEYIRQGALWNAGVFAFKIQYVLSIAQTMLGATDYNELQKYYDSLTKISFDYAVVEKAKNILVVRYEGRWQDIGSWSSFTEVMTGETIGNVLADQKCDCYHVINDLDIPIMCMGIKNITVAASPDGILIADKNGADEIKGLVEKNDQDAMYAEKSWGIFRVIDIGPNSLTIKVTMKAGGHMNYHSHDHRDEVWTVVYGNGKTLIDGIERFVAPGDVISLPKRSKHTIYAQTDLTMIEVQIGDNISISDKHKYSL